MFTQSFFSPIPTNVPYFSNSLSVIDLIKICSHLILSKAFTLALLKPFSSSLMSDDMQNIYSNNVHQPIIAPICPAENVRSQHFYCIHSTWNEVSREISDTFQRVTSLLPLTTISSCNSMFPQYTSSRFLNITSAVSVSLLRAFSIIQIGFYYFCISAQHTRRLQQPRVSFRIKYSQVLFSLKRWLLGMHLPFTCTINPFIFRQWFLSILST